MSIFGDNQFKKNRVYYRRKSLRLSNYATGLASCICLFGAAYFLYNRRAPSREEEVDELTTSTLSMQEPIKYYHLKYFGNAEEGKKDGNVQQQ